MSQQAVWRTGERLGKDASPYRYAKTVRRARSDAPYHLCLADLSSYVCEALQLPPGSLVEEFGN